MAPAAADTLTAHTTPHAHDDSDIKAVRDGALDTGPGAAQHNKRPSRGAPGPHTCRLLPQQAPPVVELVRPPAAVYVGFGWRQHTGVTGGRGPSPPHPPDCWLRAAAPGPVAWQPQPCPCPLTMAHPWQFLTVPITGRGGSAACTQDPTLGREAGRSRGLVCCRWPTAPSRSRGTPWHYSFTPVVCSDTTPPGEAGRMTGPDAPRASLLAEAAEGCSCHPQPGVLCTQEPPPGLGPWGCHGGAGRKAGGGIWDRALPHSCHCMHPTGCRSARPRQQGSCNGCTRGAPLPLTLTFRPARLSPFQGHPTLTGWVTRRHYNLAVITAAACALPLC